MSIESRDPRFASVVGEDVLLEEIGSGFLFTEGPLWHPGGAYLLFSDIPGDHIRRWRQADGVQTFRQPSNMSNGLAWDRQGRLLACEHATSRVTRTESDGSITVLASHYDGKTLNSPNDIVAKSDGAIYFTDPTYGRMKYFGRERACELTFQGVYRVDAEGKVTLLADDFAQPNGLCFSRDESRLFVNDTSRQHIRVFDVRADGTLADGRVWANTTGTGPGAPDGMKIDSAGNLYCCGPGGIHVFAPDATALGVIRAPQPAANFCFGGDDRRSLFITAGTSLYRTRVKIPGHI
ncbi:SMP-30/gluconolactonase/LRE family protein [Reyranella sp. CPCC 100927]|uniref:SMP-30/gluconolactonase/LRE family protein n=1 Tax=Reyranella sp. CPCC 100927 TaxID=2599616 RepID=UPI0011B38051|nr:SMP-30/gluconolactonase/LRE family protein [Reyranella sp. CPCC 100927]TWT05611.1 SMP-30/gluconolactonase/LRE family protein [Reyranella sp. CPCC 100927]